MSKFIKAITVVASLFAAGSALANDCGHLAFYGKTANHKKEVSICVFSEGNANFVKYRFGKVGQSPDLVFIKAASTADWAYMHPHGAYAYSIDLTNGDYGYGVMSGQSDDGVEYATIEVSKSNKHLATVKLDVKTVKVNADYINEKYNLTDFGFTNYFEEIEVSKTTVLAPRLTN